MHYYQFNIGDYVKSTRHLSPIEDLIYRRLLDLCYDTEKPLPEDPAKIARLIGLSENLTETQAILEDYFIKTQKGYIQKRVQKELKKYSAKASAARENGKLGGRPKKTQSVNLANPELTQSKAKQEPLNNNHLKESTKEKWLTPEWLNKQAWSEFESHRKEIKKPLTDLSRTKAANQLEGLNYDQQQQVIDKSIQGRWAGLFPDKVRNEENQRNSKPENSLERFTRKIRADIAAEDTHT